MAITLRKYQLLSDFWKVSQLIIENHQKTEGRMTQPAFEYAHVHPAFAYQLAHRFGVWEDDGKIVAAAFFEMNLGECFFVVKKGYEFLKKEMLSFSESELSNIKEGKKNLFVNIYQNDDVLKNELINLGYIKKYSYPITVYDYKKGFSDVKLPEGFKIISLEDENDIKKVHSVLYKGFDHGDDVDDDFDCRYQMQSAPNFKKDLTIIIKAPNGDYACFAGMWVDKVNKLAYLEPLATDPKYRRLHLASAALIESMKRTQKYGAEYCYGGTREFYFAIGFEEVSQAEVWYKEW